MEGQTVASGGDPKDPTTAFSTRHGSLCMHVLIKNIIVIVTRRYCLQCCLHLRKHGL